MGTTLFQQADDRGHFFLFLQAQPVEPFQPLISDFDLECHSGNMHRNACGRQGRTRCTRTRPAETDRPDSDVDLIADFNPPVGFLELIRAEDGLAAFFGRPLDLLTEGAISRHMRDKVLEEAEVIFDDPPLPQM